MHFQAPEVCMGLLEKDWERGWSLTNSAPPQVGEGSLCPSGIGLGSPSAHQSDKEAGGTEV